MRFFLGLLGLSLLLPSAIAQQSHPPAQTKPAILLSGMGNLHHPIATSSPEAQRFFDQGLTLIYAFNHEEAARSFRRAAELDPKAAMPHWGIALALGPNYNLDVDAEREKAAYEEVQKALALSVNGPADARAYAEALATRFTNDPKADWKQLAVNYSRAMAGLHRHYPDDLDAATIYAESLMDLRPWKLWNADGTPAEGTEEILTVLESVLRRDPDHIGANHYYIHAEEASLHPERALPSARRLETLVPGAGHLVHMPAHIYIRLGDYSAAARSNVLAARVDRAYLRDTGTKGGIYDIIYYAHDLHFLSAACSMAGRFVGAKRAADELAAHMGILIPRMPMAEVYIPTPVFVLVRFHRWDEVLQLPPPDPGLAMTTAFWHFARGSAAAAKGQLGMAEAERKALETARNKTPADTTFSFFSNKAQAFLDLAANMLDARIARARGSHEREIEYWKNAVQTQDRLNYGEPPEWFYPVRESLGAALLRIGEAAQAEAVFRADLAQNPRNGRSLYGLWQSLKAQGKVADAEWVHRAFERAWREADTSLRIEDL